MKIHLPYFAEKTRLMVGDETVEVKAYQIILWVSVTVQDVLEWDARTPKFPAILDTGHNHNFSISERHLLKWAGIQPSLLHEQGRLRETNTNVPLRAGSIWLHGREAWRLNMDEGIAVSLDGPRLPLIGLRALTRNKLRTTIYGDKRRAIVRTPTWIWPF